MTKYDIQRRVYSCGNDEDIKDFIRDRKKELETDEEKTVGQNYADKFNDFISGKIHYKSAERFGDTECPDLVYDDDTPYISLIKELKKIRMYDELRLFTIIFHVIYNYLPNCRDLYLRYETYRNAKDGHISIKDIKDNECALCGENAGLSHNMFKLLGIDSSVIIGMRNREPHAYNIIYPQGYGNEPAVIYDPSFHIDFINKEGKKVSFGYYKRLSKEDYDKMLRGEAVSLDMSTTEELLRNIFKLDGFEMKKEEKPTYSIGIRTQEKPRNMQGNMQDEER